MTLCECGCGEAVAIAEKNHTKNGYVKGEPMRFKRGHHRRGRSLSDSHKAHIAASCADIRPPIFRGESHPNWKGDDVGYFALHMWVARHKEKTGVCCRCDIDCGTERYTGTQWANLSGEYKRDLDDYAEMCVSCHKHYDLDRLAAVA